MRRCGILGAVAAWLFAAGLAFAMQWFSAFFHPGERMKEVVLLFLVCFVTSFKCRAALQAENLALPHQLSVLQRSVKRAKVRPADRTLWSYLVKVWSGWKEVFVFVKPETVIRWQRKRFSFWFHSGLWIWAKTSS